MRSPSLIGFRVGRLTVVGSAGTRGRNRAWHCQCECGQEVVVTTGHLTSKRPTQSCGCLDRERAADLHRKHDHYGTPTYDTWCAMLARCRNPKNPAWARYGGRGIRICDRWLDFAAFLADMGERPPGTSIDRFPDPAGNYEPGNCRWATATEQNRNKNDTRLEPHEPEQIRWLVNELGYRHAEVGKFFGIEKSFVGKIARGEAWA